MSVHTGVESEQRVVSPGASKIKHAWRWSFASAVAVTVLAVAARHLDPAAIGRALAAASRPALSGAFAAALISSVLCGLRMAATLRLFVPEAALGESLRIQLTTSLAQQLLPNFAAEALRATHLVRRMGLGLRVAVTVQLGDRAIDVASVFLVASLVTLPRAVCLALVALVVTLGWIPRWRRMAPALCWAVAGELAHVLSVLGVLRATGASAPWSLAVGTVVGLRIVALVPALPGQIGVVEAVFALALPEALDAAVAAAILYRLVQGVALALAAALAWRATR